MRFLDVSELWVGNPVVQEILNCMIVAFQIDPKQITPEIL